ncbi:MAG: response regulator [Methyloprofundus sp.]|nr:response regulator [Methyloprofundus sp.]
MNQEIKTAKILIIDDEESNVDLLEDLLLDNGYTHITISTDPKHGLLMYQQKDFDLVLLDLMMPEINGFELMALFEKASKPLPPPILILTSDSNHETRIKALNGLATDFLTKPFLLDEVICRIQNLIELHLAKKKLADKSTLLESLVQERTKELKQSQLYIIKSLGYAAEYKDNETAAHTIRVGKYVRLLAKAYGIKHELLDILELAAPLHDVGKIGIPDAILLKPGKFEPAEWAIMQTHAQIGADILKGEHCPLILTAKEIALTHHEKWDGSGYPNNLTGENIPISGRLTAIVDVFDALIMIRPYKAAWTIDNAVAHIKEQSGHHFDPTVVSLFLDKLPDLIKVKQLHSDVESYSALK